MKYVLQDFKPGELPLVERTIEQCIRLIEDELGIQTNSDNTELQPSKVLASSEVIMQGNVVTDDSIS